MFTQVLSIMTSLVIMFHSKERPFVLLHSQAIFSHSTTGHTSSRVTSIVLSLSKIISHEDAILPELLSDVPEDIFYDSESDTDNSVREEKIVCPKQ
jgi:hypothetical protein